MAIVAIAKTKRDQIKDELERRYYLLVHELDGRNLESDREGCKKGTWMHPEKLTAIDSMKLSLALGDFKVILAEIAKIK